jgi:integrase
MLHRHLELFGDGRDGLLFGGVQGGGLAESTYCRTWRRARAVALDPADVASPLARRPYDLRHAAVSTWLNAGRGAADAGAAWAGHSVAVLLQIHAKCLVGQEDAARRRIDAALGEG